MFTKHEMPAKVEVLKVHLSGKKFKMAKECYSVDYSKYEPHIIPHKSNEYVIVLQFLFGICVHYDSNQQKALLYCDKA